MKTELYLQIPKPCHENWDVMTPADKGRFCSSCNKEVVDFSLLSDAEVLNYFKKSTGNTCGRFSNDQLQRPLQETKIEKKKGWKWMLASVTSLIMISRTQAQKKENYRKSPVKVIEQSRKIIKGDIDIKPIANTIIKTTPPSTRPVVEEITLGGAFISLTKGDIKIEGYVADKKNNPIAGVSIYSGKNKLSGVTDWKGHFMITTDTKENKIRLSFKSFGFIDEDTLVDLPVKQGLKISMKPKIVELPEVAVVSYAASKCTALMGKVMSTPRKEVSTKDTVIAFVRKILDTVKIVENTFNVYPNPVAKNSNLHITIKEPGNYQVQLFDNASRLLHAEENTTTNKKQNIDFQLPANIASGYYYIRLINKQTKRSDVSKLIVQ